MPRPAALLAVLTILTACAGQGGPAAAGPLAGTEWQLAELGPTPVDGEAWIGFEADGTVGGNSGCNLIGGSYEREGAALTFTDLMATARACAEPARMRAEAAFLDALQATRRATATETRLELRDGEGGILAILTRRAP